MLGATAKLAKQLHKFTCNTRYYKGRITKTTLKLFVVELVVVVVVVVVLVVVWSPN